MIDLSNQRIRITVRQVETFLAVARSGSTRAAAERLARSQSAVSNALSELEDLLGSPLFDRIGRHIEMNKQGEEFFHLAESFIERAQELEKTFSQPNTLKLKIGASYTIGEYVLPKLINSWKKSRPETNTTLEIHNTERVLQRVLTGELDAGFVEGSISHTELVVHRWFDDRLAIFCAPDHPLANQVVPKEKLRGHEWVLRERGSGTREATDRILLDVLGAGQTLNEVGSNEAVKNTVASSQCLGCLSNMALEEAFSKNWLCRIDSDLPNMSRAFSIAYRHTKKVVPEAINFIEFCMNEERLTHLRLAHPVKRDLSVVQEVI